LLSYESEFFWELTSGAVENDLFYAKILKKKNRKIWKKFLRETNSALSIFFG